MKYYLITYSAEIRYSGNRVYFSKAIDTDPIDYFIRMKEEEGKQKLSHYTEFAINFVSEISKEQYLKLADN
ncbi:hypothetical protein [Clostridium butyricum]|uniref:hypothetical protein n=1 Tax=Clostridium butyricum TaxID=1492 RepID=UPI0032BFBCC0